MKTHRWPGSGPGASIRIAVRLVMCSALLVCGACAPRATTARNEGGAEPDALAPDMGAFRVYTGAGGPASIAAIVDALGDVSVMLVGEEHDDSIAHRVEALLLSEGLRRWEGRPFVLSLEMFERDVQGVLDEYLGDLINEASFLAAARPWADYRNAYRPMVELAKSRKLRVLAANAPRRYVNMVSRLGEASLAQLTPEALRTLPPLPLPDASAAYRARYDSVMSAAGEHDEIPPHAFDGQRLWDAGMGGAVAGALDAQPDALVIHYTGSFHVERRLGTAEALIHYRPRTTLLVVAIRTAADPAEFDSRQHAGLADFVVLTRK